MNLQDKIKKITQMGLTQKSIANKSGYSTIYISQFIKGERKISTKCENNILKSVNELLKEMMEVMNNE
jgi:predicted transcriptional regulator